MTMKAQLFLYKTTIKAWKENKVSNSHGEQVTTTHELSS